jgi:hypothetical protein
VVQPVDDSLQETRVGKAGYVGPGEEGKAVDEEAEQEDERAASKNLAPDRGLIVAVDPPRVQRQVGRDANDEEEEGKDQIGRSPTVPGGVFERRIDRAPGAGIIHEEHAGDGQTAKHVEGEKTLALRLDGSANNLALGEGLDAYAGPRNGRAHVTTMCESRLSYGDRHEGCPLWD